MTFFYLLKLVLSRLPAYLRLYQGVSDGIRPVRSQAVYEAAKCGADLVLIRAAVIDEPGFRRLDQ